MRKILTVCLIAFFGIGGSLFFLSKTMGLQNTEGLLTEIRAYLKDQKVRDDAEGAQLTTQSLLDDGSGAVASVEIHGGAEIDRILQDLENAAEIRRVKAIPPLSCPLVNIGDQLSGNTEKFYYTSPKTGAVFEIRLRDIDSVAFMLHVTDAGVPYQKVIDFYTGEAIGALREELDLSEADTVTFGENEYGKFLQSIDIKDPATAELLFRCIGNAVRIYDLTGASLEPEFLPVEINGRACGDFASFYYSCPATGQFIKFCFSDEDALAFKTHVMTAAGLN